VRLADVQHALAREAGVENWAALKHLIESQEPLIAQAARFPARAAGGRPRDHAPRDRGVPRSCADQHPCRVRRVRRHGGRGLAGQDAALATAKFRDTGWAPLDCLAASPLFDVDAAGRDASVAIGRRLLALGADANTFTTPPGGEPGRLSVLYRASQNGNAGLVRLLLEHGADPNDGESAYHAAERNHRDVLELLLAHGAEISATHQPWNNTILYFLSGYHGDHPLARDAAAGMEWLLEHGADPNVPSYDHRETPLHRIAEFGHGVAVAEMLLAHGADPRRPRADGRTPYEMAMRTGNARVAELLRARGAAVPLRPVDALLHACATGDESGARRLLEAHADLRAELLANEHGAILRATEAGNAKAVRVLVALGLDLGAEGPWGGTALHWAAWRGRVELVRALLAAGARSNVRDRTYGSSPIAWAAHGSAHCREADPDYIAVIDLLLDAKSERAPSYNKWNEPPENLASDAVADHLLARGFASAPAP
jgi:ankyrin repeat protein